MDDGRTDDDGRTTTTDKRTDGRVNERTTDDGRTDKTTTDERTTTKTEGRTDAGRPIFPWGQNPGIPLSRAESFTGFWLAANPAKLNPFFRGVYMNMKPLNPHRFLQIVF